VIFRGLASRIASGKPARGVWWNFWEVLALFIRDEVVRPSIGIPHHHEHDHHHGGGDDHSAEAGHAGDVVEVGHPADKYLPYVWSVFFFILACNLLGAIPFLGSPTANINVTGALALVTFCHVVFFGSQQSGFVGFWKSLVPHMDLPGPLAVILLPSIWLIEALGLLIKHGVLAVRLFANIMAGHTVLSVFLMFIATPELGSLWYLVTPSSILAQVGIGMLELFVAFLQAYVFALLTSLFISAAVNPH
jgi:F-type H+-transporting ATPase subunit a